MGTSTFRRATKRSAKLRLALIGPSGSGKTYTALLLATALADGAPVAVIDTERGSASKYADLFSFDVCELESFHPANYVQAVNDAAAAGYGAIVIDSLSHAWYGTGGMLELVAKQGKTFDAWGRVKPIENQLLDTLTGAPIHVIATMRSKVAYEVEKDERGKAVPRKIGTAPIQREGIEYEFDIAGELDQGNTLSILKSRCPALSGAVIVRPGVPLAETLRAWLAGDPTPAPTSEPPHGLGSATAGAVRHTRAECSRYAHEHGLSLAAYQRAAAKYADDDALWDALHDGVRILEEKRQGQAAPAAVTVTEADPEPDEPPSDTKKKTRPYSMLGDVELRARADRIGYQTVDAIEMLLAKAGLTLETATRAECEAALHAEEVRAAAVLGPTNPVGAGGKSGAKGGAR